MMNNKIKDDRNRGNQEKENTERIEKENQAQETNNQNLRKKINGKTPSELITIGDVALNKFTNKDGIFTVKQFKSDNAYTAFNAYKWATAIEPPNGLAYRKLAEMYFFGIGAEEDENNAYENFAKAAINGELESKYITGVHDIKELNRYLMENRQKLDKAVQYLEEYIKNGDVDHKKENSKYLIGKICYELTTNEYFNPADDDDDDNTLKANYYTKAFQYLQPFEDQNKLSEEQNAIVHIYLGHMYFFGNGTEKKLEKALENYKKVPIYNQPQNEKAIIKERIREIPFELKKSNPPNTGVQGGRRTQKKKKRTTKKYKKRNHKNTHRK